MSYAANVTLSSKQDRVHEWLRFVQVLKKKYGHADETQEHCQVVGDEIV